MADPDAILKSIQLEITGGFDLDTASETVRMFQEGLRKYAAVINDSEITMATCPHCKGELPLIKLEVVSRVVKSISDAIDQQKRLADFAQGKADGRPEKGLDWLDGLQEWQIAQVQEWVKGNREATR